MILIKDATQVLFPQLEKIRVLDEFNGPLLVEMRHTRTGTPWLLSRVDSGLTAVRWIATETTHSTIKLYLDGLLDFRSLILKDGKGPWMLVDVEPHRTTATALIVQALPKAYIPRPDSFYIPPVAELDSCK